MYISMHSKSFTKMMKYLKYTKGNNIIYYAGVLPAEERETLELKTIRVHSCRNNRSCCALLNNLDQFVVTEDQPAESSLQGDAIQEDEDVI